MIANVLTLLNPDDVLVKLQAELMERRMSRRDSEDTPEALAAHTAENHALQHVIDRIAEIRDALPNPSMLDIGRGMVTSTLRHEGEDGRSVTAVFPGGSPWLSGRDGELQLRGTGAQMCGLKPAAIVHLLLVWEDEGGE